MKFKEFKFKDFFKRFYDKAFENDIFDVAAQVAFFFSFALFPLFLVLFTLIGFILGTADDLRGELFYYLRQIMPYSAYDLVTKTIKEITEASSGGKLTIGILIAFWSASAGFDCIRTGLNEVYNLKERRAWWNTKLQSLLFTLILTLLIFIALGIVFYGWKFISFAFFTIGLPIPSHFFLIIIQWVVILTVLLTVFGIIYNFAPSFHPLNIIWITPGSITGVILWLMLSFAFRIYLQYFNTYSRFYGSLGAVIILMLWLYLTALVILVGGVINAILKDMSEELIKEDIKKHLDEQIEDIPINLSEQTEK